MAQLPKVTSIITKEISEDSCSASSSSSSEEEDSDRNNIRNVVEIENNLNNNCVDKENINVEN